MFHFTDWKKLIAIFRIFGVEFMKSASRWKIAQKIVRDNFCAGLKHNEQQIHSFRLVSIEWLKAEIWVSSLLQTRTFVRSVDSPANVNSKWNLYVGFNCVYTCHAERWSCAHRRRQITAFWRTNEHTKQCHCVIFAIWPEKPKMQS